MEGEAQKTKVGRNKEEERIEKGKERRRKKEKEKTNAVKFFMLLSPKLSE